MLYQRLLRALLFAFLLLLPACEGEEERLPVVQTDVAFRQDGTLEFVRPDGSVLRSIAIEIAETPEARAQGLMHRRSLDLQRGMLFIFQAPDTLSFWMENTNVPLDMIFVGPDSQVVNVERARPLSRESVRSEAPAQYVVEVRAGFAERFGINDSTRIRWRRTP